MRWNIVEVGYESSCIYVYNKQEIIKSRLRCDTNSFSCLMSICQFITVQTALQSIMTINCIRVKWHTWVHLELFFHTKQFVVISLKSWFNNFSLTRRLLRFYFAFNLLTNNECISYAIFCTEFYCNHLCTINKLSRGKVSGFRYFSLHEICMSIVVKDIASGFRVKSCNLTLYFNVMIWCGMFLCKISKTLWTR